MLRFLSALVVFLYHFHFNLPGYQSVMVFFILSGYFISSSVLKSMQQGTWSWSEYLIRRVVRLWIVLIPALVLTYFWAKIQIHYFGGGDYFLGTLDFKTFVGNLFFLQVIKVDLYGLNGPLWSLTYEFWYYILFPCLVLVWYSKNKFSKLAYGMAFVCISLFVGKQIMLYFLIWMLGALIPIIKPVKFKNHSLNILVFILSLIVAIVSTKALYSFYPSNFNWKNPHFIPDLSVGLAFSFLVYWIVIVFGNIYPIKNNNIPKKLAGFSYTLYLVHYPLLYFWKAWTASSLWSFNPQQTLYIKILFLFLILVYSYVLALLTENKTAKVTAKILNFKRSLFNE